jgi:hypothetical protein
MMKLGTRMKSFQRSVFADRLYGHQLMRGLGQAEALKVGPISLRRSQ